MDNNKHFHLFDYLTKEEKSNMNRDYAAKKEINRLVKSAKLKAKPDDCLICHTPTTRFCNSHSIPKFCLKQIASEGYVLTSYAIYDYPILKEADGIERAGTFHLICTQCDNTAFSDYEDPNNYDENPNQRMLAQIAIKNLLKLMDKRRTEIEYYQMFCEEHPEFSEHFSIKQIANKLDLVEYESAFQRACRALKNGKAAFHLAYYAKLDYVTPVAFQGQIAMAFDLEGNVINDLFYYSPKYKIEMLNICILPMENKSIIMMFIEEGHKRYRKFIKQFNKLEPLDQLSVISYIVILYSEDLYLSNSIKDVIEGNQYLKKAAEENTDYMFEATVKSRIEEVKEEYNLDNRKLVPNLLLKEYRIIHD